MHKLYHLDRVLGRSSRSQGASQAAASGSTAQAGQPAAEAGQGAASDGPGRVEASATATTSAAAAAATTAAIPAPPPAAEQQPPPRKQPRLVPRLLHRPKLPQSRFVDTPVERFNPRLDDDDFVPEQQQAEHSPPDASLQPAPPSSTCLLLQLLPAELLAAVASSVEEASDRASLAATCRTLRACAAAHAGVWWGGPALRLMLPRNRNSPAGPEQAAEPAGPVIQEQQAAQLAASLPALRSVLRRLTVAFAFDGKRDSARRRLFSGKGDKWNEVELLPAGLRLPSPPLACLLDLKLCTQQLGAAELAAILAHTQLTRLWLWQNDLSEADVAGALRATSHPLAEALLPAKQPEPAADFALFPLEVPAPQPAAQQAQPSDQDAALLQLASLFLGHNRDAPTDSLLVALAAPSALTYLGLPGGAASPSLPVNLGCFTRLAAVNIAGCGQYGRLVWEPPPGMWWQRAFNSQLPPPDGLERLASLAPSLTFLDLSYNELKALPKSLSVLTGLRVLELRRSPEIQDGWQHMPPSLLSLHWTGGTRVYCNPRLPTSLTRLTALQKLVATDHSYLSLAADLLAHLPHLAHVDLSDSAVKGLSTGLGSLGLFSEVTHLDLSGIHLDVTDDILLLLSSLTQLRRLSLARTRLEPGARVALLAGLPHLAHLDLSQCGLAALPDELTALSAVLTHLDIGGNYLHTMGNLPQLLSSLPLLRFLSFEHSGNRLRPELGYALAASCSQLTYLGLEPLEWLVMGPRFSVWGTPWKQLLEAVALRRALSPPTAAEEPAERRPPEQPPGLAAVEAETVEQDGDLIAEMVNSRYW